MGTRSLIGMEIEGPEGKALIRYQYCHWDGYLEHNGRLLQTHYSSRKRLARLLDLGDISSLGRNIGEKHDFDAKDAERDEIKRKGWTTAYHRDRDEQGAFIAAKTVTPAKFLELLRASHMNEEWVYVLGLDGQWRSTPTGSARYVKDASAKSGYRNEPRETRWRRLTARMVERIVAKQTADWKKRKAAARVAMAKERKAA